MILCLKLLAPVIFAMSVLDPEVGFPNPYYLRLAMELAYLMRIRLSEVLALSEIDLSEGGILARRTKRSKTQVIEWSDRLRAAVTLCDTPSPIKSFCLLHDRKGQPIRISAFQTASGRVITKTLEKGLKGRFTFHDLKAKGVTDFGGDKQQAAGQRSARVADSYNRKLGKMLSAR